MNGKLFQPDLFQRYLLFQRHFQECTGGFGALLAVVMAIAPANPVWAQPMPIDRIAQAETPLTGSWRLLNMTAPGSPMPMLPAVPTAPTVEFAGDRVFGSGGCNRFMGGFAAEGGQLSVDPLASTFMACEDGVMTQEALYLTALQAAQRYEVDDDGFLAIFYETEQGAGVLRFAAQPAEANSPAEPVQGLW